MTLATFAPRPRSTPSAREQLGALVGEEEAAHQRRAPRQARDPRRRLTAQDRLPRPLLRNATDPRSQRRLPPTNAAAVHRRESCWQPVDLGPLPPPRETPRNPRVPTPRQTGQDTGCGHHISRSPAIKVLRSRHTGVRSSVTRRGTGMSARSVPAPTSRVHAPPRKRRVMRPQARMQRIKRTAITAL